MLKKFIISLSAILIVGWFAGGTATSANAKGYNCCGPVAPSYTYNTKKVHKHVKRYRDVYKTKYVKRIKRVIHVTQIQPVIHVHNVTRVHTKVVGVVHKVHSHQTVYLPAKTYNSYSVVHLKPRCACGGY